MTLLIEKLVKGIDAIASDCRISATTSRANCVLLGGSAVVCFRKRGQGPSIYCWCIR